MRSCDTKIHEQLIERLRLHLGATTGMNRKIRCVDLFLFDRFGEELLCEYGIFAVLKTPANDVPAEDIDDDVELKACPLVRA